MSKSTKKTSAYYKDAIRKLRLYLAVETDEENCEEAAAKIREYRFKIMDEAFDRIAKRTQRLTTLMFDLKAIIANASKNDTVSGVIGELTGIVSEVSNIVNPSK
jgi:hypothetical protein